MKNSLNEKAPPGWEKTIRKMKKNRKIDNPWALAWWMKKQGFKPKTEATDPSKEHKHGYSEEDEIKIINKIYQLSKLLIKMHMDLLQK